MASGRPGVLVYDPAVTAVTLATPKVPGQRQLDPDLSGGGLIPGPGTYYSKGTCMAEGGWNSASEQIAVAGAIVGTLTCEASNASDDEIRQGTDQWDTVTTTIAAITNVATARTIDVSTLTFRQINAGTGTTARVATTAALPTVVASGTGVGKTLTASAVGILTVDGVALVLNDLVLVKDQANAVDNGLYKVTTAGTAGVAFILTRDTAMDATGAETTPGVITSVTAGTVNTGLKFVLEGTAQALIVPQTNYPYGRIRYKLVVTAGSGTVKDRRVIKAS